LLHLDESGDRQPERLGVGSCPPAGGDAYVNYPKYVHEITEKRRSWTWSSSDRLLTRPINKMYFDPHTQLYSERQTRISSHTVSAKAPSSRHIQFYQ